MTSTSLTSGWTLTALGGGPDGRLPIGITATVPGCVHTDLLAAGLIDDPYRDDNESRLTWIGRTDWAYETTFDWHDDGADRIDLVCAGLDTVATLTLNGAPVGQTANMHRSYRFDLRPHLAEGANTLRIVFHSAYDYAEAQRERLGDRPGAYTEPYNFIRKMACNFGWDWGPTVVTAGIWQDISLHSWRTARLAEVRPLVTIDAETGHVRLHLTLEPAGPVDASSFGETAAIERPEAAVSPKLAHPTTVRASVGGVTVEVTVPAGEREAVVELDVPDVARWWPRGYGEQPLYDLDVRLADEAGTELDRWQRRIGFRDVRLDTTPDEHGTPYTLVVNDVPIFVKGVNWIPDDAFVSRITRQRLAERLGQAADAHINYLRIWGGGRYESEDFYSLADELGLLVGQDFLFACAAYPQEAPFDVEVEAEAREQVVRLASHPSLVTWTGNNENIWGHADWDWIDRLDGRTWGAGFYFELLPTIVAELDPTRPYWPGSPYSGGSAAGIADRHPNDPAHGTTHEWEVWNRVDYTHYRDYVPRFMAEFGFQAPPAYATLRAAISDQPLAHDSPGMAHHQKAADGDGKLQRGLDAHLPPPRDFDDWHYLTQLNQARAITLAVEHYRSHQPVCMGSIVWQLNDCWPVTSWAAVDSAGRRKPLWHALRRSYAPRLVSLVDRAGAPALSLVNDTGQEWAGLCAVTRHDLAGEVLAKEAAQFIVPARSTVVIELSDDVAAPGRPTAEVLRAEVDAEPPAWWFYAEDREVEFPPARFDAVAAPFAGGCRVTITALTVLRDLVLYPDRVEQSATVDEALVTLLPGESATFTVRSAGPLDSAALLRRPALRAVNDVPRQ